MSDRAGMPRSVTEQLLGWREPVARAAFRMLPVRVFSHVATDAPAFALTFDDGPHRDTTPALLDVLAEYQAKATFFLIGERIRGNEAMVDRIAAEGHELANHLMRDQPSVRLPDHEFRDQLARVNALLAPHGPVRWFRPGSGWFTPRMLRSASEHGLGVVLGTLVAVHRGESGDERIARNLAGAVRPGSIVVLHEGTAQRRGVVATTDQLLSRLRQRGLASVTVSHLSTLHR